jgi:hypothetical protein
MNLGSLSENMIAETKTAAMTAITITVTALLLPLVPAILRTMTADAQKATVLQEPVDQVD